MRSEKEKMINGEMYLSADETLVNERINARRLTRMYNNTIETEIERRKRNIRRTFRTSRRKYFY